MDFRGKVVVITGASSGIGRAAALEFAGRGARCALLARRAGRLRRVAGEIAGRGGGEAVAVPCDVSDRGQVESSAGRILEELGGVDVLVNNAGFAVLGPVSELPVEEIESQMKTNYLGMVYCTKSLLPSFLERGSGRIVNVASVAASFGLPGIAPYCASKSAMLAFSEGLRHELRGTGVGVAVVSPIMVRTGFFDGPSFGRVRKYPAASLSAEAVARAVVRASASPRLEIVVPQAARGAVWLKHTVPFLVNPLVGRLFRRQMGGSE